MELDAQYEIKEACGVFGIYDFSGNDVAPSIYYGLSALQHRGQESCGIAVSDTKGPKGNIDSHKGMGLVSEVFKEEISTASMAIWESDMCGTPPQEPPLWPTPSLWC